MKKFLMFALVLCFSCIASPLLKSQTPTDDPDQIPIVIEKSEENNPSSGPKSPSVVRLQAYYDCTTSEIVVTAQNAGTSISVSVDNYLSGESTLQTISGNGISYISISGNSGFWQITFNLDNGSTHIGVFTIN